VEAFRYLLRTANCHQAVCLTAHHIMSLGPREGGGEHQLAVGLRLAYPFRCWLVRKMCGLSQFFYMVGASSGPGQPGRGTKNGTREEHGG